MSTAALCSLAFLGRMVARSTVQHIILETEAEIAARRRRGARAHAWGTGCGREAGAGERAGMRRRGKEDALFN